jgi:hypothetical protein
MKKLTEFSDNEVFYRGTIIVIKDAEVTPAGNYDKKYCMLTGYGGMGNLPMLDLYHSIGGIIIHDIKPNVKGHHGVNKEGIKAWVNEYFELFYTPEGYEMWSKKLDEIIYIEDLSDYFTQANRDLFLK